MSSSNALVRFLAIDTERVSPADTPPDYGMPDVRWAHRTFKAGEYETRLQRIRTLLLAMNKVQPIMRNNFTAEQWLTVMSAAAEIFERTDGYATLAEYQARNPENIERFVHEGRFRRFPEKSYDIGDRIATGDEVVSADSSSIVLDLKEDTLNRMQLAGFNCLITPRQNTYRRSVILTPAERTALPDERHCAFLERLVQKGISCAVSIHSEDSFLDRWLGLYDADAVMDETKPVMPHYIRTYKDKRTEGFARWKEQCGKYEQQKVQNEMGVDEEATRIFQGIIYQLTEGAVHLRSLREDIASIRDKVTDDQYDFIQTGLVFYVGSSIERGQLGDLQGLENAVDMLNKEFSIEGEVAHRLRLYGDLLSGSAIQGVLASLDTNSTPWCVTPDVYRLRLQYDADEEASRIPALEPLRSKKHRTDNFFDPLTGRLVDLSKHQEELMGRLACYVEQKMPAVLVTQDTVLEIGSYGQMIHISKGMSGYLPELSAPLGSALTFLFEHTMGRELPEMRRALPYEARRMLPSGDKNK